MNLRPQPLAVIGLLALLPVAVYAFARGTLLVGLSVVSVLVIVGSLWWMFGPAAGTDPHAPTGEA